MAPRRTAAKTAVVEAAEFDFDAFLTGFQRPHFTRTLARRADLTPQLMERMSVLDELDTRIDRLEKAEGEDGVERDITEVDALSELVARRNRLTNEYNDMANEYNASVIEFTFRTPDKADDSARIQALMDQTDTPTQPEKAADSDSGVPEVDAQIDADRDAAHEKLFEKWWDRLAIRSISVTCVSHDFTVEQWEALRDRVGVVAFSALAQGWFEAVQAAQPSSPFSLRPLPSLETAPL